MTNDLDEALAKARPLSATDHPRIREKAVLLAHQVASSQQSPRSRRKHSWQLIGGLSLSLVLIGGAAAVAAPLWSGWPFWEPDTVIERTFPVLGDDGDPTCVVVARVVADDQTATSDQEERLAAARHFLATYEWSSLENATIEDLPTEHVRELRELGLSDELILAREVSDQIGAELSNRGHMGEGVALEQAVRCDDGDIE
jgi:hypothetical protein